MAFSRMIIGALMGASLFVVLPGFASAQRVHEVRPASADEVRIAAEANASLDEVVALARRVSQNEALSADDVVANNAAAMRYSCRTAAGRSYYGNDPTRCAGDARHIGVLRDVTYRIPRNHGSVLSRLRTRPHAVTRIADGVVAPDQTVQSVLVEDGRVAELQARLDEMASRLDAARQALIAVPQERARTSAALQAAHVENARLTAKLAKRETPRPAATPPPAAPTAPANGWDAWRVPALVMVLVVALLMILFGLVILPREQKPLQDRIGILESANAALEKEKAEEAAALRTASQELAAAEEELRNTDGTIQDIRDASRVAKETAEAKAATAEGKLANAELELDEFKTRRARIYTNHAQLVELRKLEDEHDVRALHKREWDRLRDEARRGGDEALAAQYEMAIVQERSQASDPGFILGIKADIGRLEAAIKADMQAQCGLAFDARASDEWKAEYQDAQQEALQKLEASKRAHDQLAGDVVTAFNALKQETLEERSKMQADLAAARQTIADLEARIAAPPDHDAFAEQVSVELMGLKEEVKEERETSRVKLEARDQTIADLRAEISRLTAEKELLGGVMEEPSSEEGSHSDIRPARARLLTVPFTEARPRSDTDRFLDAADLPAPHNGADPTDDAVNRAVTAWLDAEQDGAPRTLTCSEIEARDWFAFLHRKIRSMYTTVPVSLHKFAALLATEHPEWKTERLRRKTDKPPPATPASSNG